MRLQLKGIDYAFWLTAFVGHLILLGVLFARGRAKSFPMFTAFIAENAARNVVLYVVYRVARGAYFNTYWALGLLDVLLQLGVFFEAARCVFRPMGRWAPDVKKGFVLLMVGSCGVAAILTAWASPATHRAISVLVLKGNFFSSALLAELFVGIMILSSWAGLPWRTHAARIATGLGAFSAAGVVTQGAHTLEASRTQAIYTLWSHIEIGCYLVVLMYWIGALWAEAPAPRELPEKIRMELAHLNRMLETDMARFGMWRKQ